MPGAADVAYIYGERRFKARTRHDHVLQARRPQAIAMLLMQNVQQVLPEKPYRCAKGFCSARLQVTQSPTANVRKEAASDQPPMHSLDWRCRQAQTASERLR